MFLYMYMHVIVHVTNTDISHFSMCNLVTLSLFIPAWWSIIAHYSCWTQATPSTTPPLRPWTLTSTHPSISRPHTPHKSHTAHNLFCPLRVKQRARPLLAWDSSGETRDMYTVHPFIQRSTVFVIIGVSLD